MDEFIDSYSDDQIYLTLLEKLVDGDPEEAPCPERIKYSSYCRLWSTMMIGSIEMMIKNGTQGTTFGVTSILILIAALMKSVSID